MRVLTMGLVGLALVTAGEPVECIAQEEAVRTAAMRPVRYELEFRLDYEAEKLYGQVKLTVVNRSATATNELPLLLYRTLTVTGLEDAQGRAVEFEQNRYAVAAAGTRLPRDLNLFRLTETLATIWVGEG